MPKLACPKKNYSLKTDVVQWTRLTHSNEGPDTVEYINWRNEKI